MSMHQKGFELNNIGNTPGNVLFAAYVGPSMNPTLCEPEMMEIVPYGSRPLRIGDVVFCLPPKADQPVVHRVARVTPAGITTRGDNNTREDPYLLHPKDIKGQVVAAWRGRKRREISGGLQGRLTGRWFCWQRILDRAVAGLLRPPYRALSRRGNIAHLLPLRFRPRVVVFHAQGQDQFRLLMGKQVVGQYDDRKRQWQIQRPFRLFVDERVLPKQKEKDLSG
ncbi:MAG: hypothetical protein H6Q55_1535 [Deltaproteobacteria bacterium]|nr:hypothetical protein [Deltaproteobacteria bacterium]